MDIPEIKKLLPYCTAAERDEINKLLAVAFAEVPWRPLPGPQLMAYHSKADIIGFGGSAGGGKTDLVAGLVLTHHERALIVRREKAQTEGVVQRLTEILEGTEGYNSQKGFWRFDASRLCEFAGLDNPGDERRWQGRPHDLKAFDEVTEMREAQVRFVMGWNRTNKPDIKPKVVMTFNPPTTPEGRWVIDFFGPWLDKQHPLYPTLPGVLRWAAMLPDGFGNSKDVWLATGKPFVFLDGEVVYDFDPNDHVPEDIIQPKSRTFIPARVTDNPYYMESGYMATLQALPEPLRSQMLYGDFNAGMEDDPWQVIPTAWVEAAQARWQPKDVKPKMSSVGVDVARGGADNTIISRRHDTWFDELLAYPGTKTPDGPTIAGLVVTHMRNHAPIHIDVIGVGASPYDFLNQAKQQVIGVNVAEKAIGTDKSGRLGFLNQRSEQWWRMREALDPANNRGIQLPPDRRLLVDLCTPTWELRGSSIYVQSREEILSKIGRSPDYASAVLLAALETPCLYDLQQAQRGGAPGGHEREYDPLANKG